jgi:chromosome segregation ATPase
MNQELATKKDLHAVRDEFKIALEETKTELHSAIQKTKKELETAIHDVKTDLQTQINVLDLKTDRLDDKLSDFKVETGEKLDTIITAVDGLTRLVTDGQTELRAMNAALYRHEDMLSDHETRINVLETGVKESK